eukprot:Polyplicarium_translucidae@DN695_c0_g1_i2.p1
MKRAKKENSSGSSSSESPGPRPRRRGTNNVARRAPGSSSESESSSSGYNRGSDSPSSSEDSSSAYTEDEMPKKKSPKSPKRRQPAKPKASAKKRAGARTQSLPDSGDETSEDEDLDTPQSAQTRRRGSPKEELVSRVLRRWWYALPPWPPSDHDYSKVLEERKLRLVPLEDWEEAEDVSAEGLKKVYQISNFAGVFRDPSGEAIDLRPLENKPCFAIFTQKSEEELHELLVRALTNQREKLRDSPYANTEMGDIQKLVKELDGELIEATASLEKLRRQK